MELAQALPDHALDRVGLLAAHHALLDQQIGEQLASRLVSLDRRGHLGLGVGRLVGLVVPESAVADEVDEHVAPEFLSKSE